MIGRTIGNYQITEELAQGSMGIVYRGRHLTLPREVVVKEALLAPFPVSTRVQLKARFRRETFIQAQLNHPGIVRVYESFAKGDNYYIVMEYVAGASLSDLLARQGLPSAAQAIYLCKQALAALEYAHGFRYLDESDVQRLGVIHRDIKPANLLVDGKGKLKLTDFGIVKMPGQQSMAPPSFQPGTFDYMPPEQLRGLELDARSDIYSLGVTFYEMLTGRLPSGVKLQNGDSRNSVGSIDPPPPLLELRPDLSPALASILTRAILRNPSERFQSAAELFRAIKEYERSSGAADAPSGPLVARLNQTPPDAVTIVELSSKPSTQPFATKTPPATAQSSTGQSESTSHSLIRGEQRLPAPTTPTATPLKKISHPEAGGISILNYSSRPSAGFAKTRLIALAAAAALAVFAGVYFWRTGDVNVEKRADSLDSPAALTSTAALTGDPAPAQDSVPPPSPIQSKGDLTKLDQARDADRLGKFNQAVAFYEEYLRSGPDQADAAEVAAQAEKLKKFIIYLNAANGAFSRQDYAAALRNYAEALKLRPYSKLVQSGLARSQARLAGEPAANPPTSE